MKMNNLNSKYSIYETPLDINSTDPMEIEHIVHQVLNACLNQIDDIAAKNLCELSFTSSTKEIKHVSILCVGHIARVYKELVDPSIIEEIKKIALDSNHIHFGVANDTLDDIEIFVTRIVRYQDW